MSQIVVSAHIEAPIEEVYDNSVDYAKRIKWDSFVSHAEFLDGATQVQVGGKLRTHTHYALSMETEYVSRIDPEVYAVKMTKGPYFIRSFAGSWRYRKMAPQVTEVSFIYNIKTRPLILQPLFDWLFKRDMKKRIHALKQFMERGG